MLGKTTIGMLVLAAGLAAGVAHAQGGGADSTAAAPDSAAPAATTAPTPEEMASTVQATTDQVTLLQSDVDRLKRFKLSGYLQERWEDNEADRDSVKASGAPPTYTTYNSQRFYLRRARFTITYDASPWGQFVLTGDGGTDRPFRLLDVYGALYDPWTIEHLHQLWFGQFNVPFGNEIERSSRVRELPERSKAENVLFPGERDRGVKLQDQFGKHLETALAVINGGEINSADFPTTDPTRGKDLVGRARGLFGWIDFGVSGYTGKQSTPLTGPDVETDRTRYGGEAQWYYEMPKLGGGSLKGEVYRGHNVNPDSVSALVAAPTAANPVRLLKPGADPAHLATDFGGGYVTWVQNAGEHAQLAVRYDWWDPNVDVDHDQFHRWGLAVNAFYRGQVRMTVAYDIPTTERALAPGGYEDPKDNLWTVQFQFAF